MLLGDERAEMLLFCSGKVFLKQELLCVCSTWCMEVSSFSSPSHFPILFFLKEENEVPEIHFPLQSPYQQMGSS